RAVKNIHDAVGSVEPRNVDVFVLSVTNQSDRLQSSECGRSAPVGTLRSHRSNVEQRLTALRKATVYCRR
ncbi:MAG: hypothetical protein ACXVI1_12625, partial [Halobacteriota archaeon]